MASSGPSGPPRICLLTTAHHTTDSRIVHREAVSLAEAGYDVTYYTPFLDDCPVDTVPYADEPPGSIPQIPDRLRFVGRLASILLDSDYDVYHVHTVEALPAAVLVGAVTDGKVVYDVHENVEGVLSSKDIFPEPVRPYAAKAASVVERGLARFADGIVPAAPDLVDRFQHHEEVTVVTNYPWRTMAEETDLEGRTPDANADGGVDGEANADENRDRDAVDGDRNAVDRDGVQFVYCGLLAEYRGILTLIEAVDRIPDEYDVSLVLGGEYASPEIRDRIRRRAGESDRIELAGWLPTFADVIDLFRESDVGLMYFHPEPNKTEAVHRSNKLFQYMATGLPVIVSDVGEWSRFVEDVGFGIPVEPERPDLMAGVMADLADDPDLRAELGRAGHEAALDQYNWETQREQLLGLYDRLLDREPPSHGLSDDAIPGDTPDDASAEETSSEKTPPPGHGS